MVTLVRGPLNAADINGIALRLQRDMITVASGYVSQHGLDHSAPFAAFMDNTTLSNPVVLN